TPVVLVVRGSEGGGANRSVIVKGLRRQPLRDGHGHRGVRVAVVAAGGAATLVGLGDEPSASTGEARPAPGGGVPVAVLRVFDDGSDATTQEPLVEMDGVFVAEGDVLVGDVQ